MNPIQVIALRGQADGAIPNGTRVVKCNSRPGDGHQNGFPGTIYSSLELSDEEYNSIQEDKRPPTKLCYFVRWDDFPIPVGVTGDRIKLAKEEVIN